MVWTLGTASKKHMYTPSIDKGLEHIQVWLSIHTNYQTSICPWLLLQNETLAPFIYCLDLICTLHKPNPHGLQWNANSFAIQTVLICGFNTSNCHTEVDISKRVPITVSILTVMDSILYGLVSTWAVYYIVYQDDWFRLWSSKPWWTGQRREVSVDNCS